MNEITIAWIAIPFFVGFNIYLFPKMARHLAIAAVLVSAVYGFYLLLNDIEQSLKLVDNFGVTLKIDGLSSYFILTNTIISAAVIFYCWDSDKTAFFYTQLMILHGSVNAVFICSDFISLYVALEVIGIAAFLLISYSRTDRSIWVALRYLFVSNTVMIFYLIGAVLVYQANSSFAFDGLSSAPAEAIAFIFLGLLTKGGIFVSGLWLPLTHSEAQTPVSALLSGTVVNTGVFPLIRCALIVQDIQPIIQVFSVGTAIAGVIYAILEKDTKRMLASSTISQLGFVMAAPKAAGYYALTHGLAKAALFLSAGNLPSRDFDELKQTKIPFFMWAAIAVGSLSISGFPLMAGFAAKVMTLKELEEAVPWQHLVMNITSVGTAIAFAKFIFLPFIRNQEVTETSVEEEKKNSGLLIAVVLLLGSLIAANGLYYQAYNLQSLLKSLLVVGSGWLTYFLVIQKINLKLPRVLEKFEHLIGMMSLVLTLLFWMVLA